MSSAERKVIESPTTATRRFAGTRPTALAHPPTRSDEAHERGRGPPELALRHSVHGAPLTLSGRVPCFCRPPPHVL